MGATHCVRCGLCKWDAAMAMRCIYDEILKAREKVGRGVDGVAWGRCSLAVNLYWGLSDEVWGNIGRDIHHKVAEKCGDMK